MSNVPALTAFALESSGPAARALGIGRTLTLQAESAWEATDAATGTVALNAPAAVPDHTVRVPRGPAGLTLTF